MHAEDCNELYGSKDDIQEKVEPLSKHSSSQKGDDDTTDGGEQGDAKIYWYQCKRRQDPLQKYSSPRYSGKYWATPNILNNNNKNLRPVRFHKIKSI